MKQQQGTLLAEWEELTGSARRAAVGLAAFAQPRRQPLRQPGHQDPPLRRRHVVRHAVKRDLRLAVS